MADAVNLKARPKATPSRIQTNISNPQAIVNQTITPNNLVHIAETEELDLNDLPEESVSVPLNIWLGNQAMLRTRGGQTAVQIAADEFTEDIVDDLDSIDIIVLPFVSHVDGRSYSHAHKLRQRYDYKGQIRAIGDVKFDQLGFLTRVGCDAFELAQGENYETALRAFSEFSAVYQPAADQGQLIFSKRRTIH